MPGWWQASDGNWYPPPIPLAPPASEPDSASSAEPGSDGVPPTATPSDASSRRVVVAIAAVALVVVLAGVGIVVGRARTRPLASAAQLDDLVDPAIVLDVDYKFCANGGGGESCRHLQDLVFFALRPLHRDLPALGAPDASRKELVDRTVGLSERIDDSYRTGAGSPTGLWTEVETLLSDWSDAAAGRGGTGSFPQVAASPSTMKAKAPAPTPQSTPVTTLPPATDSELGPVDFRNQVYPGDICPTGDPRNEVRVVDGKGTIPGPSAVTVTVVVGARGPIAGVPGTAVALTASCSAGAGTSFTSVAVYPEDDSTRRLGLIRNPRITNAERAEVSGLSIADGELYTTWSVWRPADPSCCPTGTAAVTYRWSGTGLTASG